MSEYLDTIHGTTEDIRQLVAMAIAMRNANKFLQKAVDEKDAIGY